MKDTDPGQIINTF